MKQILYLFILKNLINILFYSLTKDIYLNKMYLQISIHSLK